MLNVHAMTTLKSGVKYFSTTGINNFKVCVIGAAGGIGQPLSMLLKQNSAISELSMYDIAKHTHGVAADVSHMDYPAKVTSFIGPEQMKDALRDAAAVVIPAGIPRKPGMTRDDLFASNARLVRDVAVATAEVCAKALVTIITNPINSVVPIFCETMNKTGKLDPCRIFGCSSLDLVRSAKFIGDLKKLDPTKIKITCIGGHSGDTIIPLISQCKPAVDFPPDELAKLTKRIQGAGSEVVKAKVGTGSATLSMAHAGARFVGNLIKGLNGESGVVDCAYVMSDVAGTKYFATPLELGKNGVQKNLGMGTLNDFEKQLLKKAIPEIQKNVSKGEKFVK